MDICTVNGYQLPNLTCPTFLMLQIPPLKVLLRDGACHLANLHVLCCTVVFTMRDIVGATTALSRAVLVGEDGVVVLVVQVLESPESYRQQLAGS